MSETMPTGIHLVFGMVKPQFERARSSATIRCGPLGMVVGTMIRAEVHRRNVAHCIVWNVESEYACWMKPGCSVVQSFRIGVQS